MNCPLVAVARQSASRRPPRCLARNNSLLSEKSARREEREREKSPLCLNTLAAGHLLDPTARNKCARNCTRCAMIDWRPRWSSASGGRCELSIIVARNLRPTLQASIRPAREQVSNKTPRLHSLACGFKFAPQLEASPACWPACRLAGRLAGWPAKWREERARGQKSGRPGGQPERRAGGRAARGRK